jgi:antitoxin (DNA-binding transcriptional repressor) of toxin-antitoxin stability system
MKSVTTSEFQGQCLQLIKQVIETRVPLVITDNGQPVAQLAPVIPQASTIVGAHRGTMRIVGDILEPIGEEWEAEQ